MPYKDPSKQREFQRKWIHKRRVDHFKGKKCARCGKAVSSSTADLDHKTPKRNTDGHKIWSHSKENRSKEIKKTQILCKSCHKKKSKKDKQKMFSESLFEAISNISEEQENPLANLAIYLQQDVQEEIPCKINLQQMINEIGTGGASKFAAERKTQEKVERDIAAVEGRAIRSQEFRQERSARNTEYGKVLLSAYPNVAHLIVDSGSHRNVPDHAKAQMLGKFDKYLKNNHYVGQPDEEKTMHLEKVMKAMDDVADRFRK